MLDRVDGVPGEFQEKHQVMQLKTKYPAWPLTARRRSWLSLLGRLSHSAGLELDDPATQLLRRPPLLRRLEVYRDVEFNQFRHDVLLSGTERRSATFLWNHCKILIQYSS